MYITKGNILVKEEKLTLHKDGLVVSSEEPIYAVYKILEISQETISEFGPDFKEISSDDFKNKLLLYSALSRIPITDEVFMVNIKDCFAVLDSIKDLEEKL